MARVKTREEVDALIHVDPFFQEEIADYEVIDFCQLRSIHQSRAWSKASNSADDTNSLKSAPERTGRSKLKQY